MLQHSHCKGLHFEYLWPTIMHHLYLCSTNTKNLCYPFWFFIQKLFTLKFIGPLSLAVVFLCVINRCMFPKNADCGSSDIFSFGDCNVVSQVMADQAFTHDECRKLMLARSPQMKLQSAHEVHTLFISLPWRNHFRFSFLSSALCTFPGLYFMCALSIESHFW